MDINVVHDTHMAINLVHRVVHFVPEATEEYAAVGVDGWGGYFASRVAPMGAVPAEVVIATFYNFAPDAVRSAMPGVWDAASPVALQEARVRVVGRALNRMGVTRATRQWSDDEWSAAVGRLEARGWVDGSGARTAAGRAERDALEAETGRLCAPIWGPVGQAGAARVAELILPIHQAVEAAGTYTDLA